MPDPGQRAPRGVIDTSVVIDLEKLDPAVLPVGVAVSSVTLAELAAGPHATEDHDERSRRQDRLQRSEAAFDPLPFDTEAARAYGRSMQPSPRLAAKPGAKSAKCRAATNPSCSPTW